MNNTQWETCDDIRELLDDLAVGKGQDSLPNLFQVEKVIGQRKLVLFAVA